MRELNERLRSRAIKIANTLIRQGFGDGQAIIVAIEEVQRWAKVRGVPVENTRISP